MKDDDNKKRDKSHIRRIIIFVLSFIISYIFVATAIAPKQYSLREGDIPRVDIKAPREIIDEAATEAKENIAIEKVGKQYTLKSDVEINAQNEIKVLFEKLRSFSDKNESVSMSDKITQLKKINISITLTDNEYSTLLNISAQDLDKIESSTLNVIHAAYEKNIE